MKSKTFEILYKPYSKAVMGYILRIADYIYIVINSRLPKQEAEDTEKKLKELSTDFPQHKLVLLQGNGDIYKTDDLDILERAC